MISTGEKRKRMIFKERSWVMGLHEFQKPSSHITRQTASEFAAVEFKI